MTNGRAELERLWKLLTAPVADGLVPRWIFLRALGLIFLSAFYSLARQAHGLIGAQGVLPAGDYLTQVAEALHGAKRVWYVPSLFWFGSGDRAISIAVYAGIVCALLLTVNICPRAMVALSTLIFLSFVTTLQDFSSYQSDGMLLEAGVISIFFAPRGVRPGLGATNPPSRLSRFLLLWEWFRIYFESGLVKLLSGDVHWRNFTAMDDYYQNGPLPAWPGWYVQHLPHWYHAGTVAVTLAVELFIVWAVFLPRRVRIACFAIVTALQIGIIATANYAFLNYLVLMLGFLLLDDRAVAWVGRRLAPLRRAVAAEPSAPSAPSAPRAPSAPSAPSAPRVSLNDGGTDADHPPAAQRWRMTAAVEVICLGWIFYATIWAFVAPGSQSILAAPEHALEPFRIANGYGLFATMTTARYEIEFQGSNDSGATWTPYPFRYKPQDPLERPGIYAPYQPRFEWNLWFASLAPWQSSPWVVAAQARLVQGSPDVLALFRRDPFNGHPPSQVRTVLWQYWFTDVAAKRATGAWWRRQLLGVFAGVVSRGADGRIAFSPVNDAR